MREGGPISYQPMPSPSLHIRDTRDKALSRRMQTVPVSATLDKKVFVFLFFNQKSRVLWDMGGTVFMALGFGRQLREGARGREEERERDSSAAHTLGYIGGCDQVGFS